VPAELSSPIPSALTQLADAVPLQVAEAGHLLAYLATVPPTHAPSVAAVTRWSPSWPWPLPRC
jgi:hypothetical protein